MTEYKAKECEKDTESTGPKIGMRHVQIFFLFLAGMVSFWGRTSVSMAVVAMTNNKDPNFQTFDWTEEEKSYIFSSFGIGNILTQVLAGHFGERYGTRFIMLLSIAIPSLLTLLTPPCVVFGGWQAFCAIRILQGLTTTGLFPLFHIHLTVWSPVQERNRLGTVTYSGMIFGIILAFLLSGLLASSELGWPGVFYVPGSIGLVWSICWFFYGKNFPNDCKSITEAEKNYIQSSMEKSEDINKIPTPWKAIFTSLPFWALLLTKVSSSWSGVILLNEMPGYMYSVLNLNIKSSALYTSLPFIVNFFMSFFYAFVADLLSHKKQISLTVMRKSFNSLSEWGAAISLIGFAFITAANSIWAMVLLTISVAFSSASILGNGLNHIDLAPNHAGVLMGILNTIMDFVSIIAPVIIGKIVTTSDNQAQWQIVFFMTASIHIVANLIFLIFGKTTTQWWNNPGEKAGNVKNPA